MHATTATFALRQLSTLGQAKQRIQARIEQAEADLRAFTVAGVNAPAFVNLPGPPMNDAELDALMAREGA